MYLKSVQLANIRRFPEFEMTFREGGGAGRHVLVGAIAEVIARQISLG